MSNIIKRIEELKREKNAVILAHTYTDGAIQEVADFVGDSYGLSKRAAEIKEAEIILFAGVRFMGETAKILAPSKKVLLPVEDAGCPMADMIGPEQLKKFKDEHPGSAVVCYVNSTVETKALSDVCVTSSNALKIVSQLEEKTILFVPDQHLGSFVAEQLPEKEFVLWKGHCPVHAAVKPEDVRAVKDKHPDACVMMHPETPAETREEADFVLSTGQMIDLVKEKKYSRYIVVTERGIHHALMKADPSAEYVEMTAPVLSCVDMKKITLQSIADALESEKYEVKVSESIIEGAGKSLTRMLELSK